MCHDFRKFMRYPSGIGVHAPGVRWSIYEVVSAKNDFLTLKHETSQENGYKILKIEKIF